MWRGGEGRGKSDAAPFGQRALLPLRSTLRLGGRRDRYDDALADPFVVICR